MSSKEIAISVRNLSKSYTIAHNAAKHSTMGEALMHRLKNPIQCTEKETFWALKDVSFDIQKGDVVGIIGRNGAGKSTLLKVLSRITEPTSGKAIMNGRVGSLLEVGTGFHPELTGRENIYMNGAILGMTKQEIAKQFDAIVDFAGVEQFLDTPVKRYSSGMYVRLAFAVAAHLNPEILIVDEVLAVGDSEFQKKCLGKMQDVSQTGRTILFVSHNMAAIRQLCTSAVFLQSGQVKFQDSTEQVIGQYLFDGSSSDTDIVFDSARSPNSDVVFTRCWIADEDMKIISSVDVKKSFILGLETLCRQRLPDVELSVLFQNAEGQNLFMCSFSDQRGSYIDMSTGYHSFKIKVPGNILAPGKYFLTLIAHRPMIQMLDKHESILSFVVEETGSILAAYNANFGNILVQFPWEYSEVPRAH